MDVKMILSFFLHSFDAFDHFNRRFLHKDLPHQLHWSSCDVVIWLIFWALDEFSDAIVFPSFFVPQDDLDISAKTQNRITAYTHFCCVLRGNPAILQRIISPLIAS